MASLVAQDSQTQGEQHKAQARQSEEQAGEVATRGTPRREKKGNKEAKYSPNERQKGEVFCDDFVCFQAATRGVYININDEARRRRIKQKRAKDKPSTKDEEKT